MNYSKLSLIISLVVVVLKILLGITLYYLTFSYLKENSFNPKDLIYHFFGLLSFVGFGAFIIAIVALFKKQFVWQLYLALPLSLIAALAHPFIYIV